MSLQPVLMALLDPRGRCNRKGLLIAAAIMLGAEIMIGFALWASDRALDDPLVVPLKAALVYMAFSAAAQRLHDLGSSAWSLLWATLALLLWAGILAVGVALQFPPEDMQPGKLGFGIVFVGLLQPMLVMLVWLHFAPGDPAANRYGHVPEGLGFARAPASQTAAATSHAASAA